MNITISERLKAQCRDFAIKCGPTNYSKYSERNQNDREKIIEDIAIGKAAEWCAWAYLRKYYRCPNQPPDLQIYNAKHKNFDPDLTVGMDGYHVKACRFDAKCISWTFDFYDKPKGYIIPCIWHPEFIEVLGILDCRDADDWFFPPIAHKLYLIKKCLYYSQMKNEIQIFEAYDGDLQ